MNAWQPITARSAMNGKSSQAGSRLGSSIEQHRLEMVSLNRILSLLPKPVLPNQEDNNSTWDFQEDHHENSGGEGDRLQYPTV